MLLCLVEYFLLLFYVIKVFIMKKTMYKQMILIFKGKGADIVLALLAFLVIHCIISFYQSKKMIGTFLHTKCAICCLT